MQFLKVILIILLIYFGIKILARLFGPMLMKYVMKKAGKQFESQFNQFRNRDNTTKEEGEISIDKVPKQSKTSKNDVGEYVDYEEVEEVNK